MRSVTLHKTSCISICFWKWTVLQQRRFNKGNYSWMRQGVAHFLVDWSACLSLIFCKFLVDPSTFVVAEFHPVTSPPLRVSAECNVTVVKILTQYSRHLSESIRRSEQRLPYRLKNRGFRLYLTLLRPVVSIGTTCCNIMKICILPTKCMWFVWFLQYSTFAAVHNINRLVFLMRTNCVVFEIWSLCIV